MSGPVDVPAQRAMWESLRAELLHRIAEIDAATPWQEVEPRWWIEMMFVQRAARDRCTGEGA